MGADVHLIAYKQRITPVVRGKVMQVSADRLTDKRTGNPPIMSRSCASIKRNWPRCPMYGSIRVCRRQ